MLSRMISSVVSGIKVDTARKSVVIGSDALWSSGLAMDDTTPSPSGTFNGGTDASYTGVTQSDTSGSGSGMVVSLVLTGNGTVVTLTVTTLGSGYNVGDTVEFTDPGSTTNTVEVTLEEASISNIAIGHNALNSTTSLGQGARYNVAIGQNAGTQIDEGDANILIGYGAGDEMTNNDSNVGIGYSALASCNSGEHSNVAIGYGTMSSCDNASDDQNVALGALALYGGTAGAIRQNVAIGYDALSETTLVSTGTVAIGYQALTALTVGEYNIGIGYASSDALTTGEGNTAIGHQALSTAITSDGNIAIGRDALLSHDVADGSGGNTAVGYNASRYISSGVENTAIGFASMQGLSGNKITGTGNTCVGWKSGVAMTAASHYNTCVGHQSGFAIVDGGTYNTLMGYRAGLAMTTGDNNVAIGKDSAATPTTGANSVYIGNGADSDDTGRDGQVAVGNGATPQGDFDVRLGKHGGKQFFSANVTATLSSDTKSAPATSAYTFKIPGYSIITKVTVVITQLSNLAQLDLALISSSSSSGSDDSALSGVECLLGSDNAQTVSSTDLTNAGSIDCGTDAGVVKTSYFTRFDDGTGNVGAFLPGTADRYIWLAMNDTGNGDTNPGTAAVCRVCVEYIGQD